MIRLSTFSGGGGNGVLLAPDLTFPSTRNLGGLNRISGIDATAGLTEIINLSGKYIVDYLGFTGMLPELTTVKLTVDGEVKWDDTFNLPGTTLNLLGITELGVGAGSVGSSSILCNSTLVLEVQVATKTNILLENLIRPIQ